jgi:hypothetical protein
VTDTWRVEDIPAYQFDGSGRRPMTDEDAAMSAPSVLIRDVTLEEAQRKLFGHLTANREYAKRRNGDRAYTEAIEALGRGVRMVQVGGRGFRIRDVAACEGEHGLYKNCAVCTPENHPKFDPIVLRPYR